MGDENKSKIWPQMLAASCICIGAAGTGTVIAWTSNINTALTKDHALNDIEMTKEDMSWVGSLMTIGALVMCFFIGIVADMIGRKLTVLLTSIPFIGGWILIYFASGLPMVFIGRFLTGMGGGSFCILAPLYTSEIAQTSIRGMLGTFFQLFITIGILYANVFGMVCEMKMYIILCTAIPVIFTLVFLFMPETPNYLLKKNKPEKAEKSMARLRGAEYDASGELKEMQDNINKDKEKQESIFELLKTKSCKKAAMILFILMFYQQLSGINAVMFYAEGIFTASGSTLNPQICTIIIGAVQVVATLVASYTIDKLGRKILLMASDGGMALGTFLLGVYFLLKDKEMIDKDTVQSIGWLPISALIIFIISFSIGFGPIPWLASAELSPPALMAKLASVAGAFNWFLAFLVSKFYVTVAEAIGTDITFFIFAAISFSGIFFVLFVMPETRNKTFEEIQAELGK